MAAGLEGVVATTTRLSEVDGEAGRLTIAGYAVEDLAPHASFEEVAYLLLHGRVPEPAESARFARDLAERRVLSGAAGALKGPLHGGAPGPALDMVFEIATAERAEAVIRARLDRGERLMGFGHRIYRVRDPRADVLARAAERFYTSGGDQLLYDLARQVEVTALRLLRERKPERRLETNVEFYTALLLHGLGFPSELFTPTFAVGRVLGWSAHCLEQLRDGRLIRPQSAYIGPTDLHYDRGPTRPAV